MTEIDFTLLDGHLGIRGQKSNTVQKIENYLQSPINKKFLLILLAPTGFGKTKAQFDLLKENYGLYIDWSSNTADVGQFINYVYTAGAEKTQSCQYKFLSLIAARVYALFFGIYFMTIKLLRRVGYIYNLMDY